MHCTADETGLTATMSVVDMVWPDQANHHGTLFGGAGLSILDRQAFILGSKVLRGTVVTAAVEKLNFTAPAPTGHLIECQSKVLRLGIRSVTIATKIIAEDLLTGLRVPCLSGEFVMVRHEKSVKDTDAKRLTGSYDQSIENDNEGVNVAEIVFPSHANHRNILHGGQAMEWIAKAGFVAATRRMRKSLVMASSERLDFRAPAYVGDIVEVHAKVSRVGRRSVQVQANMQAETPETGELRHCAAVQLVYVVLAP